MSWNHNHAYRFSNNDSDSYPNTEPHQAVDNSTTELSKDISAELKQRMQAAQQGKQNKYRYQEFEGYDGGNLLKEIVAAVLPLALYRTWEATMSFGGQKPWVGTERISQRTQVTQRKIQQDLKDLQDLGLLEIKVGYETNVINGQITDYRAEYKDFSKLYDLAHEYHQWRQSRLFLIYQPIWQDCKRLREQHELYMRMQEDENFLEEVKHNPELYDEICTAEELYRSLLRFHNYRRLLTQKLKPSKSERSLGGAKEYNGHLLRHTKNSVCNSTPYEAILNSNNSFDIDSNLTQEKSFIVQDSPSTRRDGYPHDERGTHEQEDFTMGSGKGSEAYSFEIPESPRGNISQRETEPSRKGNAPRTAMSAEAQEFGDHIVERAIKEQKRVHDSGKEKCREEAEKSKAIRERNKAIINLYSHVAHELNDEYEKSTGTSLVKMYEAWNPTDCEKLLETFTERFDYARQKVLAKPDKDIIKRTRSGEPNRTPLLKTVLQGALTRGLEACIADDEHAQKVRDMWKVMGHKPTEEELAMRLELEPVIEQEVFDEVINTFLRPALEVSHQVQQEIMAKVAEPAVNIATMVQVQQHADNLWRQEMDRARIQIRETTGDIIKFHECECGSHLKATVGYKTYCVGCQVKRVWTPQKLEAATSILAQVPTIEQCDEVAAIQLVEQGYTIIEEAV